MSGHTGAWVYTASNENPNNSVCVVNFNLNNQTENRETSILLRSFKNLSCHV